ncbi:19989_t:CDS:2 [Cetraspora pellucida]|uniref:Decapping nuclease n=1 Tax=Cetraspora pellucida TaxID=1433469 RepID=A0A9N9NW60_9GLOM|nr:19989_t:CDS:2 [Cetraspora pellucida]
MSQSNKALKRALPNVTDYPQKRTKADTQDQNQFSIHPLARFNGPCSTYKQPVEIMSFSYDNERNLHMDDRELKYYYPPDLKNCDLSHGYETFVQREQSGPEPIHSLLDALAHTQKRSADKNLVQTDLVSWRGIFTKILCTPYNRNEPWELGATLWNNTIFIEEHDTDYTKEHSSGSTPRQKLMCYWGYKFENLCTISKLPSEITSSDDPELINRKTTIVNTNVQYCSVAKTSLGNNKLIMGAEVDCLCDAKPKRPVNPVEKYIELKTSKVIEKDKDTFNFERYKLLKFWAQSFLIGIPKIIVGFRDNEGCVIKVQEFKTMDIPKIVKGKNGMWNATVCLNFANQFFEWLKTVIVINDPNSSYTISFQAPFKDIKVEFMGKKNSVLAERHLDNSNFGQ